jgi:hypothetical protein
MANIVLVPKKDCKIRVCIDYKYLNKSNLKDNFSLPYIDVLIDTAVKSSTYSFMDEFLGYNQIKIDEEEKKRNYLCYIAGNILLQNDAI